MDGQKSVGVHTARVRNSPVAEPLMSSVLQKHRSESRFMSIQGKRDSFSPGEEESNANEDSKDCCFEHAYDWGGGQHGRGAQQIKAIFERSDMLRAAATCMS